MYLVTAATRLEMKTLDATCPEDEVRRLLTGVGPVETAVRLMAHLHGHPGDYAGVINFGIGGAYIGREGVPEAEILDICLAETEVFGDLGVCLEDRVERIFGRDLEVPDAFVMEEGLLRSAAKALQDASIPFRSGNFVTVSCTTGTARRGAALARQYQGLCENMEGASVARVCREFGLPCLEVRCISNLVEDRDTSRWKLKEACRKAGKAAGAIVSRLTDGCHA